MAAKYSQLYSEATFLGGLVGGWLKFLLILMLSQPSLAGVGAVAELGNIWRCAWHPLCLSICFRSARMVCMVDSGLVLVVLIITALLVCVAVLLFHDFTVVCGHWGNSTQVQQGSFFGKHFFRSKMFNPKDYLFENIWKGEKENH